MRRPFPILLADALRRADGLGKLDVWPAVRNAATYLVCNGPVTPEDRWEEDAGYSPFTLAVEVAHCSQQPTSPTRRARQTRQHICETRRISGIRTSNDGPTSPVPNCPGNTESMDITSASALPMLRMPPRPTSVSYRLKTGRRTTVPPAPRASSARMRWRWFVSDCAPPDDPRIENTVRLIDATLKTETSSGPVWHRYNEDGYGEHEDGSAFNGTGIGRGWPLLAGERAHYELARGNRETAEKLLHVMEAQSSDGGFIPEQVWDAGDIVERELFNGKPSGSAMPLMWAHAEYINCFRSLRDGRVFDMPPQTVQRYLVEKRSAKFTV